MCGCRGQNSISSSHQPMMCASSALSTRSPNTIDGVNPFSASQDNGENSSPYNASLLSGASSSIQHEDQHTTSTSRPPLLNNYDVLCGRSKHSYHHVGNHRFRVTISIFLQEYIDNPSRAYRSRLFERIADLMVECGGRFWKYQGRGRGWVALDENMARHKISHALRDAAALQTSKVPVTRTGKQLLQQEKELKRQDSPQEVNTKPTVCTAAEESKTTLNASENTPHFTFTNEINSQPVSASSMVTMKPTRQNANASSSTNTVYSLPFSSQNNDSSNAFKFGMPCFASPSRPERPLVSGEKEDTSLAMITGTHDCEMMQFDDDCPIVVSKQQFNQYQFVGQQCDYIWEQTAMAFNPVANPLQHRGLVGGVDGTRNSDGTYQIKLHDWNLVCRSLNSATA